MSSKIVDLQEAVQKAAAAAVEAARSPAGRNVLITVAAAVVGLAAVKRLNQLLTNYALANPLLATQSAAWSDWSKELVLITGGSSGMGRIMVTEFARRGIKVIVVDRQRPLENGDKRDAFRTVTAEDSFPGPSQGVHFYEFDLTSDDAAFEDLADRIRREVGDPTVLINNAGVGHGKTLLDASTAQLRTVFGVNALAPMLMTRAFLPAMIRARHGHVVNMASMASFVTIAGNVDYSCTKAGLLAFHEGLTQELKHRYNAPEVRTTVVHPHFVRTPLIGEAAADTDANNRRRFLGDLLDARYVASTVVQQVLDGRSGQLFFPPKLAIASLVRAFPTWLQERIRGRLAMVLDRPMLLGL
ncbi:hypothetical protein SEUCBS139899_004292 [Sporothrix eucalyptigena]|uniref:Uncharacterized protein n=1 Tax=Sporothrix eucalyptigena TaxID=1812306 RepID=A0ABP0BT74_9PEZI